MPDEQSTPANGTLAFLQSAHDRALSLAAELRYDGGHAWHLHLLALYGSILELGHAIGVLVVGDARAGVPIIVRSMLEAYVDFRNLARDRNYGYLLEANALKGKLRFMRDLQADTSPDLDEVRRFPDFASKLAGYESQLAEIEPKAGSKQDRSISARFARAGMTMEYQTVYAGLCSSAHNDSSALTTRHIVFGKEAGPVHFHRDVDLSEVENYIWFAVDMIIGSTVDIHDALESAARDQVKALALDWGNFKSVLGKES